MYEENIDDDFDKEKQSKSENLSVGRSKTPVLDNFSISVEKLIRKDRAVGLKYYKREQEINSILRTLLKTEDRHIAIIGEYGTGKETLIKSVVEKIIKLDASIALNRINIRKLNYEDLISGTKYRGQFEERIKVIVQEIEKSEENTFLFFSNISDAATVRDNSYHLSLFVKSDNIKLITTFSGYEAEKFFTDNPGFSHLFYTLRISPPNREDSIEIVKLHIPRLHKSFSVEISESLVGDIVDYSNLYLLDEFQPLKSISILEDACAFVELKRLSDPGDIIQKFKTEFDKLSNELEQVNSKKNQVVFEQNFLEADKLKRAEESIQLSLNEIQKTISKIGFENRVPVRLNDILIAFHNKTGIDIEKLERKESVISKKRKQLKSEYYTLPKFEVLQAQSILQGYDISIKTGLAFVLIPHNQEFDDLFFHNIKPAVESHGLTVIKADSIFKPGNILSQVWSQIRSAEVLIADVSGQNPNVIFELGLCYGIQRCPILLTRDPTELPFNIRNLRYIQYENSIKGAHKLGEDLRTTVGEFLSAIRSDL